MMAGEHPHWHPGGGPSVPLPPQDDPSDLSSEDKRALAERLIKPEYLPWKTEEKDE